MRGKRKPIEELPGYSGITPAGAGKTLLRRHCKHHIQDHPRRCGENFSLVSLLFAVLGSPPQVRGKPLLSESTTYSPRITPAGAGKTCKINFNPHNRSGSPPQVRGKRCCCCCVRCFSRITPAGAGKTGIYIYGTMDSEDHPRRCGENGRIRLPFTADTGSPPQVRGKPIPKYVNASLIRITPAGAGKT